MKRVLIILCCICLIVCLAAPALAANVNWQDYVVSTTPGFDYDVKDVFIPASVINVLWRSSGLSDSTDSNFTFTQETAGNRMVSCYLFDRFNPLSVECIDSQSTVDIYFECSDPAIVNAAKINYRWSSGSAALGSDITAVTQVAGPIYKASIDLSSKPEGAVGLFFTIIWHGNLTAGEQTFEFVGVSFDVLTPGTLTKPITIHPQDYIVNESSNGDTSTLYVSVPSSDLSLYWFLLRNDTFGVLKESWTNPFSVTLDRHEYDYWIGCQVFDKLDITDIVNGSTLNVKFDIDVLDLDVSTEQPIPGGVRFQVRYYDSSGAMLDTVKFYAVPGADFFTDPSLDVVIDKPAGAVAMTFVCQYMDIPVDHSSMEFTLDLESVNFVCDIPTMVRVQQETGRTNQLLNELVNGDHGFDSSGSNFGSEADQLAGAGDQMNDAMGSGMNSLGSMTNSVAFTGTLTTLAGVMDAVFVGHEITICGVTANPFTLLVSIFAIAILLPLGLKFVFRKWGSGGG